MIGVALEGGAERSSFTAGVMDALMAHDFYAGAASGTSAGAGCVLNYRSGQQGVALEMMIMERHSRYFGIRHMAHTGRFLNLDHMAHEYASRISWDAYRHPSMQTDFVATCCEDGKPAYLTDAGSKQRLFTAIKASCALPIICEPVELDGRHYVDGSIVDPIPFLHLLEQGCDKVLVVLTGSENAIPQTTPGCVPCSGGCTTRNIPCCIMRSSHASPVMSARFRQWNRHRKRKRFWFCGRRSSRSRCSPRTRKKFGRITATAMRSRNSAGKRSPLFWEKRHTQQHDRLFCGRHGNRKPKAVCVCKRIPLFRFWG